MRRALHWLEMPGPLDLHAALARCPGEHVALFENTGPPRERARWSYLCWGPRLVFRSERHRCWTGPPGRLQRSERDPFEELAGLLRQHRLATEVGPAHPTAGLPPFRGGAVGWLGYEMLHLIEDVADLSRDDLGIADCELFVCDTVVATDLIAGRTLVLANGFAPSGHEASRLARDRAESAADALEGVEAPGPRRGIDTPFRRCSEEDLAAARIRPAVERATYLKSVQILQEHIAAGDVYEVCLTQRFDTSFTGSGLDLYAALRTANPAPHAAYVRTPEVELLSSSPERFLRLDDDRRCETRPIKGTRPRGTSAAEDAALAAELATSEKDAAENLMIVDLSRNDLGRVCEYGSVRVPRLRAVETYAHTHQLVSTITGRLREGLGPVDLVRAAFPGGSMTGAPKVAAMKAIAQLEPTSRGPYAGSMGWFDFGGGLDLNIVIRTFVKIGDRVVFHTGGAVVADSEPAAEYQESLDKAAGLLAALELARAGNP